MSRIRHRKKHPTPTIRRPRANHQIRATQVRLIDSQGNNHGIVTIQQALVEAQNARLDLVEISATAQPPVVRIIDMGKYMYEAEKKDRESKKKQKDSNVTKGVRITMRSSEHDMEIQAQKLDKFLQKGYKVKVDLIMRGREKGLKTLADQKIQTFLAMLEQEYKIEQGAQKQPRGMSIVLHKV